MKFINELYYITKNQFQSAIERIDQDIMSSDYSGVLPIINPL